MPPTDYKAFLDHGKHAAVAAPVLLIGFRERARALWSRLFHRGEDTVEGHKVKGLK